MPAALRLSESCGAGRQASTPCAGNAGLGSVASKNMRNRDTGATGLGMANTTGFSPQLEPLEGARSSRFTRATGVTASLPPPKGLVPARAPSGLGQSTGKPLIVPVQGGLLNSLTICR